jgi:hypothetical protein
MEETFATLSVPRSCKQVQLAVRELLWSSCCELLLLEAGSSGRGHFGNPEEEERSPLKPLTRNGSEDVTVNISVCITVKCRV